MPDAPDDPPARLIATICERHDVVELALFGAVEQGEPGQDATLNLLVEFSPKTHVAFADLIEIQDEFAAALRRRVFLVPKTGLGTAIRAQTESQVRVIYRV